MYVRHATRGVALVTDESGPDPEMITVNFGAGASHAPQLIGDGDGGWIPVGPFAEPVRRSDCAAIPADHPDVVEFTRAWKELAGLDTRAVGVGTLVRHRTLGVGKVMMLDGLQPLRAIFVRFGPPRQGLTRVLRRDCEILPEGHKE
jgi:hypothetical protein